MRQLLTGLILACLFYTGAIAAPDFPRLSDRVVDESHMITPRGRAYIDHMLDLHEKRTTDQIVVVTTPSLGGLSIEEYGVQLARYWKIGEKGKNNGVLVVVATTDHEARIEVGYGLEGVLTDADTSRIINEDMLPRFRAGQIELGVTQAVRSILRKLGDEDSVEGKQTTTRPVILTVEPRTHADPDTMIIIGVALLFYILLCIRHPEIAWFTFRMIIILSSGSRSSGGQGSSFSGGGGSFGGGGASGKW